MLYGSFNNMPLWEGMLQLPGLYDVRCARTHTHTQCVATCMNGFAQATLGDSIWQLTEKKSGRRGVLKKKLCLTIVAVWKEVASRRLKETTPTPEGEVPFQSKTGD